MTGSAARMRVAKGVVLAGMMWAALPAGALAAAATATRLTLLTESSPPASMLDGSGAVIGRNSDKVREIMTRTGTAFSMEIQPWKRAYLAALERADTCVFVTTRVSERDAMFKWIGPLHAADWVLLGRADRPFSLRTLDDARALRIGTYNGDAREIFLRERGFNVDSAQNDLINPVKLLLGRIDVWAASLRHGSALLEQNGWSGRIVPVLTFRQVEMYLACNRSVPDGLVRSMNAAVDAMQRDGTMRQIEQRYEAWRPPPIQTPVPAHPLSSATISR
jgi:polar amino acid transport system substrate-binding protein